MRVLPTIIAIALIAQILCVHADNNNNNRLRLEDDILSRAPDNWLAEQPSYPVLSRSVDLIFAMKLENIKELETIALRVSNPQDVEMYGKHLSLEQVNRLVYPTAQGVAALVDFLLSNGVSTDQISFTEASHFVTARVSIEKAQQLLDTTYMEYTHENGLKTVRVAPGGTYSLPAHVAAAVDFVEPAVRFPTVQRKKPMKIAPGADSNARPHVGNGSLVNDPEFLHALYQVDTSAIKHVEGNLQAVVSFIGQYWNPKDLAEFNDIWAPLNKGRNITKQIGQNNPNDVGLEANLDTQYLTGIGTLVDTWVWYNSNQDTPFLAWLLQVANTTKLPHVFSISYGEYENGLSKAYAFRVNNEFAKLAARGVSVMVAAGDSGAGGNCSNNNAFSPDFPASSPWVTSVGGLVGGDAGKTPTGEEADFISGGGFSTLFAQPAYAKDAVQTYLSTAAKLPPAGSFNRTGNAYPVVAAQSEVFCIVADSVPLCEVSGTSCATPT
jgi:tripeptidyl-peptidase I